MPPYKQIFRGIRFFLFFTPESSPAILFHVDRAALYGAEVARTFTPAVTHIVISRNSQVTASQIRQQLGVHDLSPYHIVPDTWVSDCIHFNERRSEGLLSYQLEWIPPTSAGDVLVRNIRGRATPVCELQPNAENPTTVTFNLLVDSDGSPLVVSGSNSQGTRVENVAAQPHQYYLAVDHHTTYSSAIQDQAYVQVAPREQNFVPLTPRPQLHTVIPHQGHQPATPQRQVYLPVIPQEHTPTPASYHHYIPVTPQQHIPQHNNSLATPSRVRLLFTPLQNHVHTNHAPSYPMATPQHRYSSNTPSQSLVPVTPRVYDLSTLSPLQLNTERRAEPSASISRKRVRSTRLDSEEPDNTMAVTPRKRLFLTNRDTPTPQPTTSRARSSPVATSPVPQEPVVVEDDKSDKIIDSTED